MKARKGKTPVKQLTLGTFFKYKGIVWEVAATVDFKGTGAVDRVWAETSNYIDAVKRPGFLMLDLHGNTAVRIDQ